MEPFKEFINLKVIETLGDILSRVYPGFERAKYVKLAGRGLGDLELKQRVVQVAKALDETLPISFEDLCPILVASLHPSEDTAREEVEFNAEGACGWAVWPLTELVAMRGLNHPELALSTLYEMTKDRLRSSMCGHSWTSTRNSRCQYSWSGHEIQTDTSDGWPAKAAGRGCRGACGSRNSSKIQA